MDNKKLILIKSSKILGLSFILSFILFFIAKANVSIGTIYSDDFLYINLIIWYIFFILPISTLVFSESRLVKIIFLFFIGITLIFIFWGVAGYFSATNISNGGLFRTVFYSPIWVYIYAVASFTGVGIP